LDTRPTAEVSKPYPKGVGSPGGLGKLEKGIEKAQNKDAVK